MNLIPPLFLMWNTLPWFLSPQGEMGDVGPAGDVGPKGAPVS